MRRSLLLIWLLLLQLGSCTTPKGNEIADRTTDSILNLTKGVWRGVLDIGKGEQNLEIPFNFEVVNNKKIVIRNGQEEIEVTDIAIDEKSLSIKMPVFGSEFKLTNKNNQWEGAWHNYNKTDYKIPFRAVSDRKDRFQADLPLTPASTELQKRWKVTFSPNTADSYPAIGLFHLQENGAVTGTFLTETGDYRYLEGLFDGQSIHLSCFDGAHAFLFKADLQSDGSFKGDFWSGSHWHEPWIAVPSEDYQLTAMDQLTYLKEGYDKLEFSFPDVSGKKISLEDQQFKDKATIVQITGSWCPNCMDETRFLVDIYNKYHNKGLEIIAIDYEVVNEFETFQKSAARMREHLGVPYPMVFGGAAQKEAAAKTLPMLNHIKSYPTAIFIDKAGKVREIHTGFTGPGTGELYDMYVKKTIELIETLIAE